ncbi:MAG TPA: glycosyltransferase family A protein [bacterium]|nr:glycosyltransferase family A protein [bacterium]
MILTDAHKQALREMEAQRFNEARAILEPLTEAGGPWIIANDLALCRSMTGDPESGLALLDGVLSREPANGFARVNRFYVAEAAKVRSAPPPDPRSKIRDTLGQGPSRALISVVMPTFNRPDLIKESIASVLAQTMAEWELIVVNDGGGREVEHTMREYLTDPRVRYVYADHGGLSSARNAGMALGKGEYITQLDDDDVFYPDHLATVATAFRGRPEVKVVYTDFYRAIQEKRGDEWVTVKRAVDYSHEFSREIFRYSTIAPVCNLTHHREALETVGFYNEHILRAMDWDYFTRLSRRYDFLHVKKVTGEFREKSDRSQMTRSFAIPRNYYRNLVSFLHGFFPLTGARFADGTSGSGDALQRALEGLMTRGRDDLFMRRLELRKLISEPYYAMFYTLGKRLSEEGLRPEARAAFRAALRLRPYEIKILARWIKP